MAFRLNDRRNMFTVWPIRHGTEAVPYRGNLYGQFIA